MRDGLWEVEAEVASRLEGFKASVVAEAMENLARRFDALAKDSQARAEGTEAGSLAHAEHSAERAVYLEARGMAGAEAEHLRREAALREQG